jgi:hypothetical protein
MKRKAAWIERFHVDRRQSSRSSNRPVTPEVAGSSPVAPVSQLPAKRLVLRLAGSSAAPRERTKTHERRSTVLGVRLRLRSAHERLCQELDTRFGLEPEHETRVLYRRLLSQDGRDALRHLSPAPASPEGVRRY